MRLIFKIILLPVKIVFSVFIAFLKFLLGVGTMLLNLLSILFVIVSIYSFIKGDTLLGIEGIIVAFIFSPYGLPLIGASIISGLEVINEKISYI